MLGGTQPEGSSGLSQFQSQFMVKQLILFLWHIDDRRCCGQKLQRQSLSDHSFRLTHDSLLGVRSAGEMGPFAHAQHGLRRSRIPKETLAKRYILEGQNIVQRQVIMSYPPY